MSGTLLFDETKKERIKKPFRENKEKFTHSTEAKPTEQLQLSLGSALLNGAKIPKGRKPEEFVSTVNRYRCRKGIRKNIELVRSERHLWEGMVFATSSRVKPEK